jgi:hypothetical protein
MSTTIGPITTTQDDNNDVSWYYAGAWTAEASAASKNSFGSYVYKHLPCHILFLLSSAIPSGATIDSAALEVYITNAANFSNGIAYVQNSSNAGQLTSAGARPDYYDSGSTDVYPQTLNDTGTVTFDPIGWGTSAYHSVDVTGLIQYLVNTFSGLENGAGIGLFLDRASAPDSSFVAKFTSSDSASNRPKLTINYTAAASGPSIPVLQSYFNRKRRQ